jgi:sugar phosphate isomerase/epimerase
MRARMNSPEAKKAREDLRQWRLATGMDYFKAIGKKFSDAGIQIDAYTMNYRADFTDEEIEKTFEQAKALGTNVIATSTQVPMAKRLLPFAEKHKIMVAFHGHANIRDPNEFATPETFQNAIAMSKYFKINLDIGHFTAAGYDAVAYIQEHHDRITHLHMKDRKKDDGPNTPWGEGDTPIKAVLVLLRDKKYPIPALVEYEYRGTGTSVEEVQKCMDYMKAALA